MATPTKNMTFDVNLLPATTGDHNLGSSDLRWVINGVSNPKLSDTTYSAGTGLTLTNTTFKNERGIEYIRGTWTAASSTWTGVSIDSELYDGKQIILYMPFASTSTAATLNLTLTSGTTGAKAVYFESTTRFTTHKGAYSQLHLIYHRNHNINGTNYEGWWYVANRDTTTTNATQIQHNFAVKAGSTAIVAGNIIVADNDGLYKHLKTGTVFDITMPIFYTSVAIAANNTATGNYSEINFTVTTTQSITLTTHLPVYIKGSLSGTKFTPISTTPLTQTVPTSDDGYAYMYLGMAYGSTTIRLKNHHPIYMYKGSKFQLWLENSGANAGSYGDSSNQTPSYGSTFKVPYITVDNKGRVTEISEHTVKIPASDNTNTTYTFANGTNGFTVTPSGGTAQTVTVTPSIVDNITGSGTRGYLAKFDGANIITNGPQLGSSTTTFLRNDGTWATALTSHQDISGKVNKSGDLMTGNLRIKFQDTDKYIMFDYDGDDTAGASWRIVALGTGSADTNFFTIQSGTSTVSATSWNDVLRLGQNTYDAAFGGNVYPLVTNSKTLGTLSLKWSNVYATTFTGNLTGDVTGNVSGSAGSVALSGVTGADDLKAIEALTGTSGLLKKTSTNTWTLDTTAYTTNTGTVTSITPGNGLVTGTSGTSQTAITTSGTISIKEGGVTNEMLAGSIANEKLTNSKVTIAGNEVSLGDSLTADTLRSSLGLSQALRFRGKTTTAMSDGYTGTPAISGLTYTPTMGDVVIDSSSDSEYVCVSVSGTTYTWERLGRDSSWALDNAVIHNTLLSTKGDIIYASAANTPARLANTNSTTKQALTITSQVPSWVNISPSVSITAGTGSAAPQVNVTVLGVSGTAQSITTASTSVYGVTKLNDGIASDSTVLAATANSALIAAKKVASSNNSSKLYLVGATTQSTTGVDSYSYQYTYTNNGLLSALKLGLNLNGTEKARLEWNDTDQSIDFIFV